MEMIAHYYNPSQRFNESEFCIVCGKARDWEGHTVVKSGAITNMDGQTLLSGAKKDEGKPRWELVAYDAVEGVAKVLTFGAKKYDARNWEKGITYGRVFGAIMRHMWKWWHGEDNDAETGLSHLDHAMCEIMFLSAYEKRGKNNTAQDDRPKEEKAPL